MTRYSLLSKMMRKGDNLAKGLDGLEESEANDIHKDYSLYAFVLCDHRDIRFREYSTDHFPRLDKRTGSNLLFFSLVKPNADVKFTLQRYYDRNEALTANDYYPVNDALYQHALLEAFQISSADLPAIVVTTSLESCQWYVIRVADAFQASHWLVTLSKIADDIACGEPVDMTEELNSSVSVSTSSGRWYAVEGAPICELIAAVEAAAALSVRGSKSAGSAFEEVCERLKGGVRDSWEEDDDVNEKNGAVVRLVKYLEIISKPYSPCRSSQPECGNLLMAPRYMFEPDTVRYMDIFGELRNNKVIRDKDDYTVLCSLLHKIFESEINASVLQLMRKSIDIPMPEFYDKFYPGSRKCYVQRPKMTDGINLNRYLKGDPLKYVSPGLGKVLLAFQILSEDNASFCDDMKGFGIDQCSRIELHDLWKSICNIRNREAHCQVITEEQYHDLLNAVSHVMNAYMPYLIEMKQSLRGKPFTLPKTDVNLFGL